MMMFSLSKINLLILAVALFTIIVYFTFSFQEVLISNTARQEVSKVIEQASYLINSSNLYGKIEVSVPEKISAFSGKEFYFLMEIRRVPLDKRNSLVFSVIGREEYFKAKRKGEEPTIVASDRQDLNAELHIFSLNQDNDLCPADSTMLGETMGSAVIDNAVIVKETFEGKTHVYVIPCLSANEESCPENTQKAACWIIKNRGIASDAFDVPESSFCNGLNWSVC